MPSIASCNTLGKDNGRIFFVSRSSALASISVGLGFPAAANAGKVEDVTFPTNVIPNTSNDRPVQVKAKLYLPDVPKFPISALSHLTIDGGVVDLREVYYANELAKVGIAALGVDSFASREVKARC